MPPSPLSRRLRRVAALVVLASAALPAAGAQAALDVHACLGSLRAQCGTLDVPLDHRGAVAGTETLGVVRVPATGARSGTLVFLAGGPGQAATPFARPTARLLRPLRRGYDLVLLDERGTGRTARVDCELRRARDVTRCAQRLGTRRPFYTTRDSALDLEVLREQLGVEQLTLLGTSYGTKLAQEYVRRFPSRVAAQVLDSPAPVDGLDAVGQLRQLGLPRVLREVCTPGPCPDVLRDPAATLATVVRRVQRRPLRGPVVLPSGRVRTVTLSEEGLYVLIALSDLDPILRGELPAALASAALDDPAPLLRLSVPGATPVGREDDLGVNQARFLATACAEGRLPWTPDSPLETREAALERYVASTPRATFAPFSAPAVLGVTPVSACALWPPVPRPEPVPYAGPDVRTLILAGREDLRTPLEDARRTAAQYPRAQVLAVPDVGHSVLDADFSGCAVSRLTRFLTGGPVEHCERTPRRPFAPAAVLPTRMAQLAPAPGSSGPAGRTATAVALTLTSTVRELLVRPDVRGRTVRVPGLRGGVATGRRRVLTLESVEWIRGVAVSGTLARSGGELVVGGPAAAPGRLTLTRGGMLHGVLGGERVAVRVPELG